jgi:hypothetical protein
MYDIVVPCLEEFNINTVPGKISLVLDELPRFEINSKPWRAVAFRKCRLPWHIQGIVSF